MNYRDYLLPAIGAKLPARVWAEPAEVSGTAIKGRFADNAVRTITVCATPAGEAITLAAWRGEKVDPSTLPLSVSDTDIQAVTTESELESLMVTAAADAGIVLDFRWRYAVMAEYTELLHPELSRLLNLAQHRYYQL